jgi:hypothetical protein
MRRRIRGSKKLLSAAMKQRANNERRKNEHDKKPTVLFGLRSGKDVLLDSKSDSACCTARTATHTHTYPKGVFVCEGNACAHKKEKKEPIKGLCWGKGFLLHYMCSPCFEAEVSEDERQSWLLFEEPLFEKPLLLHLVFPHPLFVYWRRFTAYRPLSYDGAFPYNTDVLPRSGIAMSVSSESSAAERKSSQQVPSGNFTVGSADVNVTVNEAFDGFAI